MNGVATFCPPTFCRLMLMLLVLPCATDVGAFKAITATSAAGAEGGAFTVMPTAMASSPALSSAGFCVAIRMGPPGSGGGRLRGDPPRQGAVAGAVVGELWLRDQDVPRRIGGGGVPVQGDRGRGPH